MAARARAEALPAEAVEFPVPYAAEEGVPLVRREQDRKSTRLNSSHSQISYAVFCLKKKNIPPIRCTIIAQDSCVADTSPAQASPAVGRSHVARLTELAHVSFRVTRTYKTVCVC